MHKDDIKAAIVAAVLVTVLYGSVIWMSTHMGYIQMLREVVR